MKHKENILKLRAEGKSYNEISRILDCSKSTISYHCGPGRKAKVYQRTVKHRKDNPLSQKVDFFKQRKPKEHKQQKNIRNTNKAVTDKVCDYRKTYRNPDQNPILFKFNDVIEKFGIITQCYLTGKIINLKEPQTYQLDHIVPASRGGENSLENLGIASKEANLAKSNLTVEEFISLCKSVLEHNGYEVKNKAI